MFHSYHAGDLQPERFRAVREQIGDGPQGLNRGATIPRRRWQERPMAASGSGAPTLAALALWSGAREAIESMTGTVPPDNKPILTGQIEKAQPFC